MAKYLFMKFNSLQAGNSQIKNDGFFFFFFLEWMFSKCGIFDTIPIHVCTRVDCLYLCFRCQTKVLSQQQSQTRGRFDHLEIVSFHHAIFVVL